MAKTKSKKKKNISHVTYNQKSFLAADSILSMAAIHTKIKPNGEAIVRISDCNQTVRIWNDLNTREGKIEIVEKVDMLINQLEHFRAELLQRCPTDVLFFIEGKNHND
jgi:hypothetical protein